MILNSEVDAQLRQKERFFTRTVMDGGSGPSSSVIWPCWQVEPSQSLLCEVAALRAPMKIDGARSKTLATKPESFKPADFVHVRAALHSIGGRFGIGFQDPIRVSWKSDLLAKRKIKRRSDPSGILGSLWLTCSK